MEKDVYEDPVFSMIVEMPKDECYWKIIPQSNVDGGDIWAPGALGVATNSDDSEWPVSDRKPASRKNPCQRMGENHLEHARIYL